MLRQVLLSLLVIVIVIAKVATVLADEIDAEETTTTTTKKPYRSNFRSCCALGKQTANSSAESCHNYSNLIDNSGSCRYAFTICCNQNRRDNECERGKKHAYSGKPCSELNKTSNCDALTVSVTITIFNLNSGYFTFRGCYF